MFAIFINFHRISDVESLKIFYRVCFTFSIKKKGTEQICYRRKSALFGAIKRIIY